MRIIVLSLLVFTSCFSEDKIIQVIDNPANLHSSLPRLYTDDSGTLTMSWVETKNDTSSLYFSKFEDQKWLDPQLISSSDSWFVNWADFPSMITHNGEPLAAHWLDKIPGGTYAYNVEVFSFLVEHPLVPHLDNTPTEHGFVSMVPVNDSSFYAIWLDGRNMIGGHDREHSSNTHQTDILEHAMTLRGALISTDYSLVQEHEIDDSVCECCNTSLTKVSNKLIAAYRNRTVDENRDIYVAIYENGTWSDGVPVFEDNWLINGCPVNGPMLDSFDKTIALGWFTGTEDRPKVKLAFSNNEGVSFSEPILVDIDNPLGRVDVEMTNSSSAWISWISRSGELAQLNVKRVSITGDIMEEYVVAEINPSRRTGFPQISNINDQLMIAWTDISGEQPIVKTILIQ